jgi:hypothetical protein
MVGYSPLITDILNVHENFFKLFTPLQGYSIPATINTLNLDDSFVIPVFYADEASAGYAGTHNEVYPQMVIQDFPTEPSKDWNFLDVKRYEGSYGAVGNKQSFLFSEPIRLKFRYDVTVYTRDPFEKMRIQSAFIKDFMSKNKRWLFNGGIINTTQEDIEYGTAVSYTVEHTENLREDNIRELNYTFSFEAMMYYNEPVLVQVLETFTLTLNSTITSLSASTVNNNVVYTATPILLGDKNSSMTFSTPALQWSFAHNLGFKPVINVYDLAGREILGYSRVDSDNNSLIVRHNIPLAGIIIAS